MVRMLSLGNEINGCEKAFARCHKSGPLVVLDSRKDKYEQNGGIDMHLRMNHRTANPAAYQAMRSLEEAAKGMGLEPMLFELIKTRASQLNGCAYCVDMHAADLLKLGESQQRLNLLAVWRDAPQFTERERAALALTEALVHIADAGVPQAVYEEARRHFDEREYIAVVMAVNAINGWNRLSIATGMYPGCFDR